MKQSLYILGLVVVLLAGLMVVSVALNYKKGLNPKVGVCSVSSQRTVHTTLKTPINKVQKVGTALQVATTSVPSKLQIKK